MKKLMFLAFSLAFLTMACTSSPKSEQVVDTEDTVLVDTVDTIAEII